MRLLFVIAALMLINTTSGENVIVGNYSVEFNLSQPHEIDASEFLTINNTYYQTLTIKTVYGEIYIIPGIEEMTNPDIYTENIEVDGVKGVIGFPSETNSLYKVVIGDTFISSGLPFYETADLLRTLHIRPLNKNAS